MTVTPTDEQLVHATLAGDQASFALLVRRYRRAALARALAVVADDAEAEDVAQEAFIQAYAELWRRLRRPMYLAPARPLQG